MKRRILSFALAMAIACGYTHAGTTVTYTKVTSGGTLQWNVSDGPGWPCFNSGTSCTMEKSDNLTVETVGTQFLPGVGWLLEVPFGAMSFRNVATNATVGVSHTAGYTFVPNQYTVRIDAWPENPGYVGVTIPLNGHVVSSSETITVFVPL